MEYHFFSKNLEIGEAIRKKVKEVLGLLEDNFLLRQERVKSRVIIRKIVGFSSQEAYSTPSSSMGQRSVDGGNINSNMGDKNNNSQNNDDRNCQNYDNNKNSQNCENTTPSAFEPHDDHEEPHEDHEEPHEEGFIADYKGINRECVSTPRKTFHNLHDVNIDDDIIGDMFLMLTPNEDDKEKK
jgi:hypothetical protein